MDPNFRVVLANPVELLNDPNENIWVSSYMFQTMNEPHFFRGVALNWPRQHLNVHQHVWLAMIKFVDINETVKFVETTTKIVLHSTIKDDKSQWPKLTSSN